MEKQIFIRRDNQGSFRMRLDHIKFAPPKVPLPFIYILKYNIYIKFTFFIVNCNTAIDFNNEPHIVHYELTPSERNMKSKNQINERTIMTRLSNRQSLLHNVPKESYLVPIDTNVVKLNGQINNCQNAEQMIAVTKLIRNWIHSDADKRNTHNVLVNLVQKTMNSRYDWSHDQIKEKYQLLIHFPDGQLMYMYPIIMWCNTFIERHKLFYFASAVEFKKKLLVQHVSNRFFDNIPTQERLNHAYEELLEIIDIIDKKLINKLLKHMIKHSNNTRIKEFARKHYKAPLYRRIFCSACEGSQ